jgi:anti-anti-sigma factor
LALQQKVTVIALEGELDLTHREAIAEAFELAIRCPVVIVDFAKATYIDSTVLSLLLKFRSKIDGLSSRLILTQASGGVARLFEVAQLQAFFTMRPALAEVLAELEVEPAAVWSITLVGDRPGRESAMGQPRSEEHRANGFIATE